MSNYVLSTFRFEVVWGGTKIGFSEASGLSFETEVIEYQHGAMPESAPMKSPGRPKYGDITLKRGMFKDDNEAYEWFTSIRTDESERRDINITLLDQNQQPVMVWEIRKAWVSKLESASLNASASEAAIETMTLAIEGLTQRTA